MPLFGTAFAWIMSELSRINPPNTLRRSRLSGPPPRSIIHPQRRCESQPQPRFSNNRAHLPSLPLWSSAHPAPSSSESGAAGQRSTAAALLQPGHPAAAPPSTPRCTRPPPNPPRWLEILRRGAAASLRPGYPAAAPPSTPSRTAHSGWEKQLVEDEWAATERRGREE